MPTPKRIQQWWEFIEAAATKWNVEPYLLAAVMDRESLGGVALEPPGPGGTGDHEHGLGLMQVDARFHPEFAVRLLPSGTPAWKDAAANIDMGASILAGYLVLFKGNEAMAVAAYNAGPHRVSEAVRDITRVNGKPPPLESVLWAVDACCTGGDYASDVLRRRELFKLLPALLKSIPPPEKPKP
jgi:soluble lytic murein transglycosylase-like protein